ncbi:hypothetical protein KR059_008283 [Drosophila kikkawai]|nr:hypothetical protein KR059_008283 [Drosophila kikkawai]
MAAVRSEFPSESNSNPSTKADSLRSLKKHVATCWHNLCKKLQQPASFRKSSHSRFYKIFVKADCSASFPEKSKFLRQFHRIFKAGRKSEGGGEPDPEPELWKVPLANGQRSQEQLQIVARLFSSTLISTKEEEIIATSRSSNCNTSYTRRKSQSYCSTSTMTIIEGNYREVRDEYPDIDAEVRAILLSHAQNGITISSIKDEYRKQTGNTFPLHDNVTDFLLTIPYVTAECSHTGKRIFNLKPNKENSHLLEMVLNQKQRSDYSSGAPSIEDKYRMGPPQVPPRYWRNGFKRRALSPLDNNLNVRVTSEKPADDQSKAINTRSAALPHMAKAAAESNWCYQDNWNHLKNIYQQSSANAPQMHEPNQIYTDPPELSNHLANPELIKPPCKNHNSPNLNQILNPNLDIFRRPRSSCDLKRRHERTPTPTTMSSATHNDSMLTISSDYDAYLLDFPLMGDDLLLYLARMELKCRFRRYERVLQSGLCVSGQTINAARNRLKRVNLPEGTQIIVNIGSVDILRGKPLVQIEHDFRLLIKEMHNRRFVPILTNLAPLANYCHDKGLCDKVLRFNNFIRSEGRSHLKVIDIHSCLINERGVVRFDCFQNAPRSVSGSKEPYLFWNKIGRQRVLQMIESSLEY